MNLNIKSVAETHFDLISLGEILLRFCPGEKRIQNTRSFEVYDGGGEYNVAKNLANCFRQRASVITALADNPPGRLAENLARSGGVDVSNIIWRNANDARNGLYFIERGFGLRAPNSSFDRENTAVSELEIGDDELQKIISETRWFHTGGIFAGLSETTAETAQKAMKIARDGGAIVSYDLNYRDSLWRKKGGREAANRLNRSLLQFADVVFGVFDFDSKLSNFNAKDFQTKAEAMKKDFPNLKIIVSTLREIHAANRHSLGAVCLTEDGVFQSKIYENVDVFDRVGSGDAFASGFIYSLLKAESAQFTVDCGTASAVLAMTTAGDNLAVSKAEIESLMRGDSANVKR